MYRNNKGHIIIPFFIFTNIHIMYDTYYLKIQSYYYKFIYNNFPHISLTDMFDLVVNNSYCVIIVFKIIVLKYACIFE